MISKFSVRKPLTIIVSVIVIIVLGFMSFTNMTPDLLPSMDFPYVMIITTYPGASPEEVEEVVSKPLEQSMSTLDKINNVTSTSSENYSMVTLEFSDDANMDSVSIDIRENIDLVKSSWTNDLIANPFMLKISADLLPISVAAVDMDGMDTAEISYFVENELQAKLEGIEGVASISTTGLLTEQLNVVINEEKIEDLNKEIQAALNKTFEEPEQELNDAKNEIESGIDELEKGKEEAENGLEELNKTKDDVVKQLSQAQATLDKESAALLELKLTLVNQMSDLQAQKTELLGTLSLLTTVKTTYDDLMSSVSALDETIENLTKAQTTLNELNELQAQFDEQIKFIEEDESLTQAEKDIFINAIKSSEEYTKLQQDYVTLDATLASLNTNRKSLNIDLLKAKSTKEIADLSINTILNLLKDYDITPDMLDETIKELENGLALIDAGLLELQKSIDQIDDGQVSLSEANAQLLEQTQSTYLELNDATTQLITAQSTIAGTEKELNTALTQVESGMEELNIQKENALESADASNTITIEMVSGILMAQNFSMPAGYIEEDGQSYLVRVGDKFEQDEDIEDLLLFDMGIDGVDPIYLNDVADIFITDNSDTTYSKVNSNSGVMFSFTKQSNYATATVADNINQEFTALEEEYEGLHFTSLMDQGDYIDLIIGSVFQNLIYGAILAILILLVFLRDFRPTLIIACSIPVSVIFAIVLMYFSGVTLNIISMSGLAVGVGMLVDNSVVVIENIYRLRNKGYSPAKSAISGAVQVGGAITASTLTTICVFLPIVFVQGITRQLFTDMALTIGYSLLASLIIALTLVPAISQGLLRKQKKNKEVKILTKFLNLYEKTSSFTLRHRLVTLLVIVAILAGSTTLVMLKGFTFMPDVDSGTITVTAELPEEAVFDDAVIVADELIKMSEDIEGVETVGAMISGSSAANMIGLSSSVSNPSTATNITMYVIPYENSGISATDISKQIEQLALENDKLKDTTIVASSSSSMTSMTALTGTGVTINLFSDNLDDLAIASNTIAQELKHIDGVSNIESNTDETTPEIKITVDKEKAMLEGLTVAQVFQEVAKAITAENTSTTLSNDGTNIDVVVIDEKVDNFTTDDIYDLELTVTDMQGEKSTIALKDIATITNTETLNSITRDNQRRYVPVVIEPDETTNVTLMANEIYEAMENIDLPSSVSVEYQGENEAIMESIEQLGLMLLLAVLLIYLIMVAQFQSFLSPFIVMFTIPLAFTGGFLGLLITNNTLSVISMVGFVMLSGIIVNNGIVLIDYINQLRASGMEKREAILEAAKTRMRPIMMTALTTILGLTTMALGIGEGSEMMQPVAIVCIGGLIYATILTLYVIPIMYDIFVKKDIKVIEDEELEVIQED